MKGFLGSLKGDRQFFNKLFVLALPIMIQNFIVSSLNMVDTLMIGKVGEDEIAALGIANQLFFMFNLIIIGVTAGCCMFISQYWGSGDKRRIKNVSAIGLTLIFVTGAIFTLAALVFPSPILGLFTDDARVVSPGVDYVKIVSLSYIMTGISFFLAGALRSIGSARLPMVVSAIAVLINAGLNYIFIFGNFGAPKMGVKGAALGTLIARICEIILIMILAFKKGSALKGGFKEYFGFDGAFAKKIMASAFPVILNEALWGLGMTFYTAAYGQIGKEAIAVMQICNTVLNLMMVACFSIANAAMVMVGHEIGGGDIPKAKVYAERYAVISFILGLLMGASILIFSNPILSLFNVSENVKNAAVTIFIIFAIVSPVRAMNNSCITGIFRGGGDAKFALAVELVSMWIIGVPLAFLGAAVWGLTIEQVVILTTAEEVFKVIMCLIRFRKGKWIHDLTK